jgi:hypothetical protein
VTVNSVARSSVNAVLTEQLNSLSGKYIKDVELNVDIQSTDQYNGTTVNPQTAVAVGARKEFLNSRMSVQVGGNINVQDRRATTNNANTITGDAVIEYKLTEDGRYRFKAFRENQYEGIIDGVLYRTGIGFLFTRDFDRMRELFMKPEEPEVKPAQ